MEDTEELLKCVANCMGNLIEKAYIYIGSSSYAHEILNDVSTALGEIQFEYLFLGFSTISDNSK